MKTYLTVILCLKLLLSSVMAEPSPTGHDVLKACQQFLARPGQDAVSDMLCHWYATPCDCSYSTNDLPRVCLPENYDERQVIVLLSESLTQARGLLQQDAQFAANTILSHHYPCDDAE